VVIPGDEVGGIVRLVLEKFLHPLGKVILHLRGFYFYVLEGLESVIETTTVPSFKAHLGRGHVFSNSSRAAISSGDMGGLGVILGGIGSSGFDCGVVMVWFSCTKRAGNKKPSNASGAGR